MKRTIYLLLISFVALVGCKDDESNPTTNLAEKTFTVTFRQLSRVAFASGDTLLAFAPGDEIAVFDVSQTNRHFVQSTSTDGETHFTGITKESTTYYAVSPYSAEYELEENFITNLQVPAVQQPVAGGFDPNAIVLVGSSSAANLQFRAVNALLRVNVRMDGIDRINLTANDGCLRGPVGTFEYLSTGLLMHTTKTTKTVTLQATGNAKIEAGKDYYLAILPDVYSKGFTLEALDKSGKVLYHLYRPASTTFAQGSVYDFCAIGLPNGTAADGREWADLGLPSGTRWSTANVGAAEPTATGDYYSWGMTTPFVAENWNAYPYLQTEAASVADPVSTLWGKEWATPTNAQFEELANPAYTEWERTEDGCWITSLSNGERIFLPAAGALTAAQGQDRPHMATSGFYWTSTPYNASTEESYRFIYTPTESTPYGTVGRAYRIWGLQLRPVLAD